MHASGMIVLNSGSGLMYHSQCCYSSMSGWSNLAVKQQTGSGTPPPARVPRFIFPPYPKGRVGEGLIDLELDLHPFRFTSYRPALRFQTECESS